MRALTWGESRTGRRFYVLAVLAAFVLGSSNLIAQEVGIEPSAADLLPVVGDHFESTASSVVTGLTPATCFTRPVANYKSADGCLEFLQRNPKFGNQRHAADDFCAAEKTRVNAIAPGKVMYARAHGSCPNWGHLIAIEHLLPNGTSVVSIYGHVVPSVKEGSLVARGQQIGSIGKYSCWQDHVHFGIAQRDYGASMGTYASWLTGYLADGAPISPYTSPEPFVISRLDCPPVVGNHTYSTQFPAKRVVTVRFSDPEGQAPKLKAIKYQYKDPIGQSRTGSGELTLSSGSAGNGTYSWSATIFGSQFKFYTEWRDAAGNFVRYPATGLIE